MRRLLFSFALSLLVLFSPKVASSELIHGTATLYLGYNGDCDQSIDFSTQSLVNCHTPEADFAYYSDIRWLERIEFGVYPGETMITLDVPFEDVDLAPLSGTMDHAVKLNRTYVVKTRDPLYAKVAVISINVGFTVDVRYVVQTDGSRVLGTTLPVESATWGRIKALYRD